MVKSNKNIIKQEKRTTDLFGSWLHLANTITLQSRLFKSSANLRPRYWSQVQTACWARVCDMTSSTVSGRILNIYFVELLVDTNSYNSTEMIIDLDCCYHVVSVNAEYYKNTKDDDALNQH